MTDGASTGPSRTIRFDDGRVVFFSAEEFINKICATDCCFVCGTPRGSTPFNDEHVIPRWIVSRYGLFKKQITLPNGHKHSYGTYKMPCCAACNSLLGNLIESPISEMLDGSFELISEKLEDEGPMGAAHRENLYIWLCLLFIKTHLKDRHLREHLDFRLGGARIADQYDWLPLHHIHCVARMPYVTGSILSDVVGTMCWYRIDDPTVEDQFDYFDLTNDHTIAIRLGEIGIVAVLTDAGACRSAWHSQLMELQGKTLTMAQLRELAARLAMANRDLLNRPTFFTFFQRNALPPKAVIVSQQDGAPVFADCNPSEFGGVLEAALASYLPALKLGAEDLEESKSALIAAGKVSFLFDKNQHFIRRIIPREAQSSSPSRGQDA